jgi:SAM-dependent methyltransferase
VIGIEHNLEMLAAARQAPNVEYRNATAQETGLPDGCADIVTCAQSFHWMEHRSTIAEIARILRPEGVFAAYDYDWPPLIHWEIDAAFMAVIAASGVDPDRPEKARHLERLRASGRFRWVREVYLHSRELADYEDVKRFRAELAAARRRQDRPRSWSCGCAPGRRSRWWLLPRRWPRAAVWCASSAAPPQPPPTRARRRSDAASATRRASERRAPRSASGRGRVSWNITQLLRLSG